MRERERERMYGRWLLSRERERDAHFFLSLYTFIRSNEARAYVMPSLESAFEIDQKNRFIFVYVILFAFLLLLWREKSQLSSKMRVYNIRGRKSPLVTSAFQEKNVLRPHLSWENVCFCLCVCARNLALSPAVAVKIAACTQITHSREKEVLLCLSEVYSSNTLKKKVSVEHVYSLNTFAN